MGQLGVVAIGRNEGDRLRHCLDSIGTGPRVVYVDSASTDGSVELARSRGVEVVELDMSIPFSAARARNAGLERLLHLDSSLEFVQFVDGDCELDPAWLPHATAALNERPDLAVMCGRRRERFPDASVYNRLCDLEWDTPIGETDACGGDALMRVAAVKQVGGFRDSLIAGEEPELCLRLRRVGWRIERLDAEMTLHDAAMTGFRQWWRRAVRAGHAFAEVSWLHRHEALGIWRRETRSNWFWGVVVPVLALAPAYWTWGGSLLLFLGYPLLFGRIYRQRRRHGDAPRPARQYALFCVLSKFANAEGQLRYHYHRLRARPSRLIEYKPRPT